MVVRIDSVTYEAPGISDEVDQCSNSACLFGVRVHSDYMAISYFPRSVVFEVLHVMRIVVMIWFPKPANTIPTRGVTFQCPSFAWSN